MNIIKLIIHYKIMFGLEKTDCINRCKEESIVEFRTNYEPGDINSATSAIDNIIMSISQKKEELQRQSENYGFTYDSGAIELIITREDETIISNLVINNQEELEIYERVYEFLRKNFFFV